MLKVNFTLPAKPICVGQEVFSVRVPGAAGEFGIQLGHSPTISELKPGLVRLIKEKGAEPQEYFISGGYCVIHASGVADISAVEAYKVEDLDVEAAKAALESLKGKMSGATGEEKAALQVEEALYSAVIRSV